MDKGRELYFTITFKNKYLIPQRNLDMPQEKELISSLEKDYATYEKLIKSLLKSYSRFQEFLSGVFQIFPSELFFVLLVSLCVLVLLNSVSRKIREYHLLVAVVSTVLSSIIISRYVLHKHRDMGFISSGMIILVPTYLYSLIVYTVTYAKKQYLKNKIASTQEIEESVHGLHLSYNRSMQHLHRYLSNEEINVSEVREQLEILKIQTESLIKSLEFPGKKLKEDSQPTIESSEAKEG